MNNIKQEYFIERTYYISNNSKRRGISFDKQNI